MGGFALPLGSAHGHLGRSTVDVGGLVRLARQSRWRWWTFASFCGRLPVTMTLIALVLAGEKATGSLAVGAQLAGAATIAAGLTAPWRGRRLDRRELRAGLQRSCVMGGAVLLGQATAVALEAPAPFLFALAAVQGLIFGAVPGGYRALLPVVVPREDLSRANSVEAVNIEVAFVLGPALAGVLALAVGPVGVLVSMAGFAFASAAVAATLPQRPAPAEHTGASPWRSPAALPVFGIAFSAGLTVGLFEAALPPRAAELGYAAASAGPLLALMAAGSGFGGVIATLRNDGVRRARLQAVVLLGAFGLLLVPLAASGSVLLLGVAMFAAGIPIAPLNALGTMLLQEGLPASRLAEGFAAYTASVVIGIGIGQSLTGLVLDQVGAQALLYACAAIPLAMALAVAQRAWRGRRVGPAAASPGDAPGMIS